MSNEIIDKNKYTIGYYGYEKKIDLFNKFDHYLKCDKQGKILNTNAEFVILDIKKPIQGHFDLIIHKLLGNYFDESRDSPLQRLQHYTETNQNVIYLDPINNVSITYDRIKTTLLLNSIFCKEGNHQIKGCPTITISSKTQLNDFLSKFGESLHFPLIIKPLKADEHDHQIVYNLTGITDVYKLFAETIIQRYVFHGGIIFKVFVIGNTISVYRRPSLDDNEIKKKMEAGEIALETIPRISKPTKGFNLKCKEIIDPPSQLIENVCKEIKKIFGLNLFGLDLITEIGTNNHFIIDINYCPSYSELDDSGKQFYDLFTLSLSKSLL